DMFENHRLGDDFARIAHEIFQERLLACLQFDLLPGAHDLAAQQIKHEIAHDQARRFARMGGAADQSLNAREQFGKREWLGQVIVATRLQAAHAIIDSSLRAEHNDRYADVLLAQLLHERKTVELWQHDVHDGNIVWNG